MYPTALAAFIQMSVLPAQGPTKDPPTHTGNFQEVMKMAVIMKV